jgi:hypothetical protein
MQGFKKEHATSLEINKNLVIISVTTEQLREYMGINENMFQQCQTTSFPD